MSKNIKQDGRAAAGMQKQQDARQKEWERHHHQSNMEIVRALNRVADELKTNEEEQKSSDRKKACREWLTIILVFSTVVAAGFGDIFIYGQLDEMKTDTVLNYRPWITNEASLAGPLILKTVKGPQPPHVRLDLKIQNIGNSPALNTWPRVAIFETDGKRSLVEELKIKCPQLRSEAKAKTFNSVEPGLVLFKDHFIEMQIDAAMSPGEYESLRIFDGKKVIIPVIAVCTEYRLSFSSELHHTDAAYYLTRTDDVPAKVRFNIAAITVVDRTGVTKPIPPPPYFLGIDADSEDVPASSLYLFQQSIEDTYTD